MVLARAAGNDTRSSSRYENARSMAAAEQCGGSSLVAISASKKTLYAAAQKRADVARARARSIGVKPSAALQYRPVRLKYLMLPV